MQNNKIVERSLNIFSKIGLIMSFLLIVMISYLSLISAEKINSITRFPFDDKGAHMLAYALLGVFLYFSFIKFSYKKHHTNRDIIVSNWILLPSAFTLIVGVAIGTIIELIQAQVGRQFELFDVVADGLGLLVGCAIGYYIIKLYLTIVIKKDYIDE